MTVLLARRFQLRLAYTMNRVEAITARILTALGLLPALLLRPARR